MTIAESSQTRTTSPKRTPLGEELPIFCERCGYSLYGLPQNRCERCTVLQFVCPECGHHQPINTLRPAAQTMLGRVRGAWLVLVILFKLNFFVWPLLGWFGMGATWSYMYDWEAYRVQQQAQTAAQAAAAAAATTNPAAVAPTPVYTQPPVMLAHLTWESFLAFSIFGIAWGIAARMLLLRWKRGWKVGTVLALLASIAIWIVVVVRRLDFTAGEQLQHPWPFHSGFIEMNLIGAGFIILGASIAWPVWVMLVKAFLPKRTSDALLEWQNALSINVAALARDPQTVHETR